MLDIPVQLDPAADRPTQPGKTWDKPGDIPGLDEICRKDVKVTLDRLRALGIVAGADIDKNEQIKLDVDSVVTQLWGSGSWETMVRELHEPAIKPISSRVHAAVARHVFDAWFDSNAFPDNNNIKQAVVSYVANRCKEESKILKVPRAQSKSSDHAKEKKRQRERTSHSTDAVDGRPASKKPKTTDPKTNTQYTTIAATPPDAVDGRPAFKKPSTTKPPTLTHNTTIAAALTDAFDAGPVSKMLKIAEPPTLTHDATITASLADAFEGGPVSKKLKITEPPTHTHDAAFTTPLTQFDTHLQPAPIGLPTDTAFIGLENRIEMDLISLAVSRDAAWDGSGPPPSTHPSGIASLCYIRTTSISNMGEDIILWLLGPDVAWKPKLEFIVLLSLDGEIIDSPDDDIERLCWGLSETHKRNGTMFKIKIVARLDAVDAPDPITSLVDVVVGSPQTVDGIPPIKDTRRSTYDNHEFDDKPASFLDQTFDSEDQDKIVLPPPLTSAEDMDTTHTRFTKDEYNRARAVFNLSPVRRFKAELIRIPWIRRTLWSHQLIWIVQGMDKFEDLPAHWLADEQGLGKTMEGTAILWAHNVVLLMDRSIDEWRRNPEKAHRSHCAPDAPTGTKCPSQSSWPIRCKCEPGSPTRNWKSANKPSLVVCMVKSTIGDWAKEVGTFCSNDAPFALLPIICHGSEKSSGGSTTVLKGNGRPKISYNDTVEAADLICGENGRYAKTVCDHILITSEQSIGSYVLNPLGLTDKNGKATKRPPDFQIGLVDESHQATGAGSGFAKALKLLASSAKPIESVELDDNGEVPSKDRPIKFVFMSGTMFAEVANLAPYWVVIQNLVQSLQAVWKHEKDTTRLDRAKKRHTRILDCDIATAKVTYTKPAEGSGERGEVEMDSNIGKILADISIRRRQNTRIPEQRPFNTPLVLLPAVHDLVKNVSYPPEVLKTCNDRLVNLSKKILKDRKGKSKKITTIERELINQSHTVQILGSLPSLYGMMSDFDGWKQSLTQINMNTKFGGVKYLTTSLDDNPLRKKVRDTCSNDPKIRTLRSLIDAVLATDATRNQDMDACRQKDPESFPGAAADYSEKIIVTAQNTFTAMATYDILQKAYPHIGIALHHSVLGDKEKEAIIKGFTDEKDAEGQFKQTFRPRILVAVQFPISTGLNLQRANVIIALEPCSSPTQESQMRCRVLRIGQRRECYIYRFYVKGLKFEDVVTNRRTRREMLKEAAYSTETLMED